METRDRIARVRQPTRIEWRDDDADQNEGAAWQRVTGEEHDDRINTRGVLSGGLTPRARMRRAGPDADEKDAKRQQQPEKGLQVLP